MTSTPLASDSRSHHAASARTLAYVTIGWNALEAMVAVISGIVAGSVSLVGFGFDSLIEVTSGGAVLWRMRADADPAVREVAERKSLRIVGVCFFALALYVAVDAIRSLAMHDVPDRSLPGIALTAVSSVLMPILARAKRRVGRELRSQTVLADSRQTDFCAYLSWIVLSGLLLHDFAGLWWADSAAALLLMPFIVREGVQSVTGRGCECESLCDTNSHP